MILKNNWHIIIVFLSIINTTSFIAQNNKQSTNETLQHLTDSQRVILAEQQLLIDKAKVAFKESLSIEQKKILENKMLSRKEKKDLLKKSLSKKQRLSIKSNKKLLRDKQIRFKQSLTKRQTIRLRKLIDSRNIRKGKVHDRRRLTRRLRRLIRDNLSD